MTDEEFLEVLADMPSDEEHITKCDNYETCDYCNPNVEPDDEEFDDEELAHIKAICFEYEYDDGGRSQYFKGTTGDCATRAMAIALERDYLACYQELSLANYVATGEKTARKGIYKNTLDSVLKKHGWKWNAAPKFQGRKAKHYDMPRGKVIARMSKHFVAVIDGIVWDTWDSTSKMIYGYWSKE